MTELQINKDFVLRKVCGVNVVLPAGLQDGKTAEEAAAALTAEYDVTPEKALASVQKTIDSLREAGVVS